MSVIALIVSFGLGVAKERLWWYDNHLYWLDRYSEHLHDLVERGQIEKLTNDIIIFDVNLHSNDTDPKLLADTMYRILKLGPYYSITNAHTAK
jgi:hypothetical protein